MSIHGGFLEDDGLSHLLFLSGLFPPLLQFLSLGNPSSCCSNQVQICNSASMLWSARTNCTWKTAGPSTCCSKSFLGTLKECGHYRVRELQGGCRLLEDVRTLWVPLQVPSFEDIIVPAWLGWLVETDTQQLPRATQWKAESSSLSGGQILVKFLEFMGMLWGDAAEGPAGS